MAYTYNFAAGPAMLPLEVTQKIKQDLFNWNNTNVSIMEIGHRTAEFQGMLERLEQKLRELLAVPKNYKVLFLSGGAQAQFDAVPLNLTQNNKNADYLISGLWSERAAKYAAKYAIINIVSTSTATEIPNINTWQLNPNAAYFYYCANETINGIRLPEIPSINNVPIITDMTSSILSENIDVNKFGVIFASAQKNLGIAGITLVIIRDDLLDQSLPSVPEILNYKVQAKNNSCLNTIPTFPIYVMDLMVDWVIGSGGISKMAELTRAKANKLYQFIDANADFYVNRVNSQYRSYVNIPFDLANPELLDVFLKESSKSGLLYLKGHKLGGGLRASLYNAMPLDGVEKLIEFMQNFLKLYG